MERESYLGTSKRLTLVIIAVLTITVMVLPHSWYRIFVADTFAVFIGILGFLTVRPILRDYPFLTRIIVSFTMVFIADNHSKLAIATGQEIGVYTSTLYLLAILFSVGPIYKTISLLVNNSTRETRVSLILYYGADSWLIILLVASIMIPSQVIPLLKSNQDIASVLIIYCVELFLAIAGTVLTIGRSYIPFSLWCLLTYIASNLLFNSYLAVMAMSNADFQPWFVLSIQTILSWLLIVLFIVPVTKNDLISNSPGQTSSDFRTLVLVALSIAVVSAPNFAELGESSLLWGIVCSLIILSVSVRMWTLSFDRQAMIDDKRSRQVQHRYELMHDQQTGFWSPVSLPYLIEDLTFSSDRKVILAFINANEVNHIIDSEGLLAGDEAIEKMAVVIENHRAVDTSVVRYGKTQFIIVMPMFQRMSDSRFYVQNILDDLNAIFDEDNPDIQINISSSLVIYNPGMDVAEAVQKGELTTTELLKKQQRIAKIAGNEAISTMFDSRSSTDQVMLATKHEDFILAYQPIIEINTHACIGLEALSRWPETNIKPLDFIPDIEKAGMTESFGRWVLRAAAEFAKENTAPVFVNISSRHLYSSGFIQDVRSALVDNNLPPELLAIEIAESGSRPESARMKSVLQQIQDMGVRVVLDDMGCGGMTLFQLFDSPIDVIKIDSKDILDMSHRGDLFNMFKAYIRTALDNGVLVVAEEIDSSVKLEAVMKAGITHGQGYFWSQAVYAKEAALWWNYMRNNKVNADGQ